MKVALSLKQQDVDGVWANYPGRESVRLRIARAGNPVFLRVNDRLEAPFRKQLSRGRLPTEQQLDIQCRAMAEGILTGWEGLATEDGAPLEYSAENAYLVLRYNSDVREFVFEFATDLENYRREEVEEVGKK
jgi:hypothetical protein